MRPFYKPREAHLTSQDQICQQSRGNAQRAASEAHGHGCTQASSTPRGKRAKPPHPPSRFLLFRHPSDTGQPSYMGAMWEAVVLRQGCDMKPQPSKMERVSGAKDLANNRAQT